MTTRLPHAMTLAQAEESIREKPLTVGELEVVENLGAEGTKLRPEDYMRLVATIRSMMDDPEGEL